MTTHRLGLGPGLPVFPCESFTGPWGLELKDPGWADGPLAQPVN